MSRDRHTKRKCLCDRGNVHWESVSSDPSKTSWIQWCIWSRAVSSVSSPLILRALAGWRQSAPYARKAPKIQRRQHRSLHYGGALASTCVKKKLMAEGWSLQRVPMCNHFFSEPAQIYPSKDFRTLACIEEHLVFKWVCFEQNVQYILQDQKNYEKLCWTKLSLLFPKSGRTLATSSAIRRNPPARSARKV